MASPKFSFEELADSYERGYTSAVEGTIVRCASNLLSLAQEYRNRGDYVGAQALVDAWESTCLLSESPHDG